MTDKKIIYPSSNELKDVLFDSVKHSELMSFLQGRGVFYLNTSREDAAMLTSRLLLDADGLETIRQFACNTSNKSLLSGFTMVADSSFELNSLYDTILDREVLKKGGYHLKTLSKIGDSKFEGNIIYQKRRPGKNVFLKYEERDISFTMERHADNNWQVEIDGENSNDGKVIQQMFMVATKEKGVKVEEILFDGISNEDKISFFDRLAKEGLDEQWIIKDVLRLTLKKPKPQAEETTEEEKEGEEKEATQEQLSGIAQAILEGENLRENKFVHLAEKGGYVFSSMTYLFERKADNCHLKIRAEFKGSPKIFEVSLEGFSQTVTDAEEGVVAQLSPKQNYQLRSAFWNAAKKIYNELRK